VPESGRNTRIFNPKDSPDFVEHFRKTRCGMTVQSQRVASFVKNTLGEMRRMVLEGRSTISGHQGLHTTLLGQGLPARKPQKRSGHPCHNWFHCAEFVRERLMHTETLILSEDDNSEVVFEVEEVRKGPQHVSTGAVDKAKKKFKEVIDDIAPLTKQIIESLTQDAPSLDSIEVEMGIKVSGEAGAVIAKASTEGNLVLKMKWTAPKSD